jgi:iron uptake system EfeUOB component EfeO/EfeM
LTYGETDGEIDRSLGRHRERERERDYKHRSWNGFHSLEAGSVIQKRVNGRWREVMNVEIDFIFGELDQSREVSRKRFRKRI